MSTNGIPLTFLCTIAGYGWTALFYATLLVLAITDSRSFVSRILRWRWLRGLGTVSYGVYLFHYGIYGLCMWLLRGHGNALVDWKDFAVICLAVTITIAFATLSWRYFEKPIVRWSHKQRCVPPERFDAAIQNSNAISGNVASVSGFEVAGNSKA
jgi:peptidoglycan/LPS O-acetylase OafA/YrhL